MKSGVYDGADRHPQADGPEVYPRGHACTPGTTSRGGKHPFDRTTKPVAQECDRLRTPNIPGRPPFGTRRTAGSRPARSRARWSPAARMAKSWQHHDPLVLDMYKKMGGASVLLRHFARMHEGVKLYRQAERALREFRSTTPGTSSRPRRTAAAGARPRRSAARCATGSRSKAARSRTTRSSRRRPGTSDRARPTAIRGPIEEALIGVADRRSARSRRGRACLPLLRFLPRLHGSRS